MEYEPVQRYIKIIRKKGAFELPDFMNFWALQKKLKKIYGNPESGRWRLIVTPKSAVNIIWRDEAKVEEKEQDYEI